MSLAGSASENSSGPQKPLLRGHFHQAAFFTALGACLMLVVNSQGPKAFVGTLVYSVCLFALFGISSLYHRVQWSVPARQWMRRLDHSAIFLSIAGTGTPVCLLAVPGESGMKLLLLFWVTAALGILQSLFWVKAPKWLAAIFYVGIGWIATPYLGEIQKVANTDGLVFLLLGGVLYSLGAVVYALKWPNPLPKIIGYHEIFHLLVVIAAIFHFVVVAKLAL